MRGVTLAEISVATRISTKFLEAIENGNWDQLPGGAFNRGYIRSTSRYLGLDEDGMVAEYALETNGNGTTHAARRVAVGQAGRSQRLSIRSLLIVGGIILLIALAWFVSSKIRARLREHKLASNTTAPVPAGGTQPAGQLNAPPLLLLIHANGPVQLRITADGASIFNRQITANDTYQFNARNVFDVQASDAGAVRLELNRQLLPPLGPSHQPGRVTLTAKDLKSSAGGAH